MADRFATYRLQLRAEFGFDAVAAVAETRGEMGIPSGAPGAA